MSGPLGVDWTTALLVLAAGLVLGTVFVWKMRGQGTAADTPTASARDALKQRDLLGKRDALLGQLRELEDTGAKRTAEQLAQERYALELEAARVLLALDAFGQGSPSAAIPAVAGAGLASGGTAAGAPAPQAGLRGFLWGTLSASAVGLLLFLLYTQARPRPEGGSLTGDIPSGSGMASGGAGNAAGAEGASGARPAAGPEEEKLRERVARDPGDLGARMDLARAALARQDMMGVWNETKEVLERSPGHAQAMAYQALVRLAMGQGDKAVELLQQSLAKDPNLIDAYVHLALVYARIDRMADAEKTIADATRRFPDEADGLLRLLADLKQSAGAAQATAAGDADPHAGIDTAGGPSGRGAAAASGGLPSGPGKSISGTVELDPALAGQVGSGGILFVFVREAGFGAGPPIAARRLPATSFPVRFEIGEADAMMGQAFPNELLVEARLDADGDPTTRPPTDPKARVDDVKAGSAGVKLVLKRAS